MGQVGSGQPFAAINCLETMPIHFAKPLVGLLLVVFSNAVAAQKPFADELATLWGLEPMHRIALTGDDIELRFWITSFGHEGYVLSRRQGRWLMFHLGENQNSMVSVLNGYRAAQVQPMCDPDQVLAQLKTLGLDSLQPPRPIL